MEAVTKPSVKEPHHLSPRIQWLRDYYFQGEKRSWNNEFSAFTTGTPWDEVFDETSFLIVPEVYSFFPTFRRSFQMSARTIEPPKGFDRWRDTNIRVTGSAASLLQVVFAIDWHNATGEDLLKPDYFPPAPAEEPGGAPPPGSASVIANEDGVPVQMSVSGPDSEWRAIRHSPRRYTSNRPPPAPIAASGVPPCR